MPEDLAYIAAAQEDYGDKLGDDLIVQTVGADSASGDIVDRVDGGAWVKAWVWVPNERAQEVEADA